MSQTRQITLVLKQHLKQKGITYAQLAARLDLSEASVKRLFSESSFTLKRLESVCEILELDFFELARLARGQSELSAELSEAQEAALAGNPKLLSVFYLLLNQWQLPEIGREFEISEAELVGLLTRLDRLQLIELHPNNNIKLLTHSTLHWRVGGPIRKMYQGRVIAEFLRADFAATESLRFEARELGAASLAVLQRKLQRLAVEFNDLAEIDASLPSAERQGAALGVFAAVGAKAQGALAHHDGSGRLQMHDNQAYSALSGIFM
jgi:DNA-binding Xre family transcriptional regulator